MEKITVSVRLSSSKVLLAEEMDCVIDIQGFNYGPNYSFLPKEVAVVAVSNNYSEHWIISPPCSFKELRSASKSANTWLTNNHHGIEWFENGITLEQLKSNIRRVARIAPNIIVRGREKAEFIQNIIGRNVINFEDNPKSPSFRHLPSSGAYCISHGAEKAGKFRCALNNAHNLKQYINSDKDFKLDKARYIFNTPDRSEYVQPDYKNYREKISSGEDSGYESFDEVG